MEQQHSYVLKLSLTDIALRKVVVSLCNQTDILGSIVNILNDVPNSNDVLASTHKQIQWRETIQEKVKVKLSALVLPEELKTQMMHIVKPIGGEMLSWKIFHENYLNMVFDVPILEKICWTSVGSINYQKTAEKLILCEMLDIVSRYKLASFYCLEDYIHVLWNELPENHQNYFYNEMSATKMRLPSLQYCWAYILKGEESKLVNIEGLYRRQHDTFLRYAFEHSANTGNKAVAENLLQKIPIEEREVATFNAIFSLLSRLHISRVYGDFELLPLEKLADTLCHFLSLMKHERQVEIFKEFPYYVLLCCLHWPCQDLFFEIADRLWNFLSAEDFYSLLLKISSSFKHSEYYFPKLFREFVTHKPVNVMKECIDHECDSGGFIRIFSFALDLGAIKLIFGNLDAVARVRLLTSEVLFYVFYGFVISGMEDTVEVWLRESGLCREDKNTVREAFIAFLRKANAE